MNKKLLKSAILALLCASSLLSAQLFNTRNRADRLEWIDFKKYSWGFYLNMNDFDYNFSEIDKNQKMVTSKTSSSFGAGLIGRMRLNEHLDLKLEPGMQFLERELIFKRAEVLATNPQDIESFTSRKIKSTYVDVPLLLEFHGNRWFNSRVYVAGGVNWLINLQSQEKSRDDNMNGVFRTTTHNLAWSAELGIQFYFSKFKLTPGFRGTFVINNELVRDNPSTPDYWAGSLSRLNTRAFMFILKFE